MGDNRKPVVLGNLGLPVLDDVIIELEDVATVVADEVVVVLIVEVHWLVSSLTITEAALVSHSSLLEELERPVDGRIAHTRLHLLDKR